MKSFKNKMTGVILTPKNAWVEEQLSKDTSFEEIVNKKSTSSNEKKAIKDYNKKELVAYLKTLDIEANEDMKKEDLLALIPEK